MHKWFWVLLAVGCTREWLDTCADGKVLDDQGDCVDADTDGSDTAVDTVDTGDTQDDTQDTGDTQDTTDTQDTGDTQDTADTQDTGDTQDTADTGSATPDACGNSGDGVWIEVDFSDAYSETSPDWAFSATPGFGAADWAYGGESYPEVWDPYNGINMNDDPIGTLAEVPEGAPIQLMIGLSGISSYSSATVCVEGRSVSTNAGVTFAAYNPGNGDCGVETSMSHDWTVHAVSLDLGNSCFVPGSAYQALRIEPTGGSGLIGITRFRLTLHDAVY